nr:MAG TPA: hypothetical protein [Bacteriophage sp.]
MWKINFSRIHAHRNWWAFLLPETRRRKQCR